MVFFLCAKWKMKNCIPLAMVICIAFLCWVAGGVGKVEREKFIKIMSNSLERSEGSPWNSGEQPLKDASNKAQCNKLISRSNLVANWSKKTKLCVTHSLLKSLKHNPRIPSLKSNCDRLKNFPRIFRF